MFELKHFGTKFGHTFFYEVQKTYQIKWVALLR